MSQVIRQKAIALVMNRFTNFLLVGLIFGCVLSYIYFANMAVRTVTLLEKTKSEVQALSVEVSEMESKRLLVDNTLGAETAKRLGLVEVVNHTFIVNKTKKTTLSFNTD